MKQKIDKSVHLRNHLHATMHQFSELFDKIITNKKHCHQEGGGDNGTNCFDEFSIYFVSFGEISELDLDMLLFDSVFDSSHPEEYTINIHYNRNKNYIIANSFQRRVLFLWSKIFDYVLPPIFSNHNMNANLLA